MQRPDPNDEASLGKVFGFSDEKTAKRVKGAGK